MSFIGSKNDSRPQMYSRDLYSPWPYFLTCLKETKDKNLSISETPARRNNLYHNCHNSNNFLLCFHRIGFMDKWLWQQQQNQQQTSKDNSLRTYDRSLIRQRQTQISTVTSITKDPEIWFGIFWHCKMSEHGPAGCATLCNIVHHTHLVLAH